jgi:hypothetical protein
MMNGELQMNLIAQRVNGSHEKAKGVSLMCCRVHSRAGVGQHYYKPMCVPTQGSNDVVRIYLQVCGLSFGAVQRPVNIPLI